MESRDVFVLKSKTRINIIDKRIGEAIYLLKSLLSTTMIVFCKILCHYKSLTPSKSMQQKSNYESRVTYPYIWAGTIEPMRIKNIWTKNRFLPYASMARHIMT